MNLAVEEKLFAIYQLNQKTDILVTAAEDLICMGNVNLGVAEKLIQLAY